MLLFFLTERPTSRHKSVAGFFRVTPLRIGVVLTPQPAPHTAGTPVMEMKGTKNPYLPSWFSVSSPFYNSFSFTHCAGAQRRGVTIFRLRTRALTKGRKDAWLGKINSQGLWQISTLYPCRKICPTDFEIIAHMHGHLPLLPLSCLNIMLELCAAAH